MNLCILDVGEKVEEISFLTQRRCMHFPAVCISVMKPKDSILQYRITSVLEYGKEIYYSVVDETKAFMSKKDWYAPNL